MTVSVEPELAINVLVYARWEAGMCVVAVVVQWSGVPMSTVSIEPVLAEMVDV